MIDKIKLMYLAKEQGYKKLSDIAKDMDISLSTLSSKLNSNFRFNEDDLRKLKKILNCEYEDLFTKKI